MSDDDPGSSPPNLEPPRLFGRARRGDDASGDELEPPPEGETGSDDEPTAVEPFSDPTWLFEPPEEEEPEPEPVAPVLPAEVGAPLFADEVEEAPKTRKAPKAPKARKAPRAQKPRRAETNLPPVAGWVAAPVTGVLVGLSLVGLTAGALKGCESVRGTSTCGGWGVPLLLLIMGLLIVLGGLLLRLFHVPDPVTTSFLALGMVAVIALLALLDVLESPWMLVVIPAITVAMYLLAYWVTTAFVEPAKEPADR